MSNPITTKTIEYRIERNRRMESYKGKYNCEILINKSYMGDAQGDTASEAKRRAELKVREWTQKGVIVNA